jgi:hypothetical protein
LGSVTAPQPLCALPRLNIVQLKDFFDVPIPETNDNPTVITTLQHLEKIEAKIAEIEMRQEQFSTLIQSKQIRWEILAPAFLVMATAIIQGVIVINLTSEKVTQLQASQKESSQANSSDIKSMQSKLDALTLRVLEQEGVQRSNVRRIDRLEAVGGGR